MADEEQDTKLTAILRQTVFVRDANVPFGELTVGDARSQADRLRAAVGWGPTARVAPVALAWRELANAMERDSATTVSDLAGQMLVEIAPRLWIVPPGGGLL